MKLFSNKKLLFTFLIVLTLVLSMSSVVFADGEVEEFQSSFYATFWALIPPVVAIALALITKEVYSSLFVGIVLGGLLSANWQPVMALDNLLNDGIIAATADTAGIFVFLVILGILVALINKSGGSAAFGRWAETHI